MNTKHTPGPWKVTKVMELRKPTHYAVKHNNGTGSFNTEVVAQCEREANARLIAAAPELLAALEDAEFLLRKIGNNPREVAAMVDSFKRSAEDARAAIAKATL